MTYHASIGPRLSAALGGPPVCSAPHLRCDRCGAVASVYTRRGDVAASWLRNRTLRGWATIRTELPDGQIHRDDVCPACRRAGR